MRGVHTGYTYSTRMQVDGSVLLMLLTRSPNAFGISFINYNIYKQERIMRYIVPHYALLT